jgi:N-acyl-D-aspartate/D-glutamate deacylase
VARYFDSGHNFLMRIAGPEQIFFTSNPRHPAANGHSLGELSMAAGLSIADFCCETLLEAGPFFMSVGIRHVYATEEDLRAVLALPYCSIESDGVVTSGEDSACGYPWNASSYGYVARVLGYYVRQTGFFSVEDAVHRLSRLPAISMGLLGRGYIAPGAFADVVVLDLKQIADRTSPAHVARYPSGIRDVLVNGTPVVRDGLHTGARPGSVLRRSG